MREFSDDENFQFFDAQEVISPVIDNNFDGHGTYNAIYDSSNPVSSSFGYDVWLESPASVIERRNKFLNWMERVTKQNPSKCSLKEDGLRVEVDRMIESSGAVLRESTVEDEFCFSQSSSYWSSVDRESFSCRDCNSDDAKTIRGCEISSDTISQPNGTSDSNSSIRNLSEREFEQQHSLETSKSVKKIWWKKLRSITCVADKQGEAEQLRPNENHEMMGYRLKRVKVRRHGKQFKKLSALYRGQDIHAHEGSILTMKFSPDGQYLASAGEDGTVRLWKVVEDDWQNELDVPEIDPSCIYFTVNHLSDIKPLFVDKENLSKLRSLRKTSDSACIIFPPKVFRILEKPFHEFHGHCGDILDLSWSKNNDLLSCSVDKTVRLWRVGCENCLAIFSHSDYVTCVQFNPVDDGYFLSGSIDGKVRVWNISAGQVVDWTDIRDIVTALCYKPDGKGGIVGSMTGTCRFYTMSDNHLVLDAQICFRSKRKSSSSYKRITGLQYFPHNSSKVAVTCADSQVTIVYGHNVIGRYKGQGSAGNQMSAMFTSDGKHIVSVSEDSNVYMWNCCGDEEAAISRGKNIKSHERFFASASVAMPWHGFRHGNAERAWNFDKSLESLPFNSRDGLSLSQDFFLESFPKGRATWPEEKLPASSPLSSVSSGGMHKSHYQFLKSSCQGTSSFHACGLVIVIAGWDGRISTFHNYGLPVAG